jgi:hypothetical protein
MSSRTGFIFIGLKNFHANIQFDALIYRFCLAPNVGETHLPGSMVLQHKTIFTSKRRVVINIRGPEATTAVNLHFPNIRPNNERKTFLLDVIPI